MPSIYSSVRIAPREGLVPASEAHLGWTLWIDGKQQGHFATYQNAELFAKAVTLGA